MYKCHYLILLAILVFSQAFAATPINLQTKTTALLQTHNIALKKTSASTDQNHTKHLHYQQMYQGYPILGADFIIHQSQSNKTTMDGRIYQNLKEDLNQAPAYVFSNEQKQNALTEAIKLFQPKSNLTRQQSDLVVYIDKNNKAHWAYQVSFFKDSVPPVWPHYILDAKTLSVYQQWDDVQTLEPATGGGYGGNEKIGKLTYDAMSSNLPTLTIERDETNNTCYLENDDVKVLDMSKDQNNPPLLKFQCEAVDHEHGAIYWDGEQDKINGAYSPANDALYTAKMVKEMFQKWYHIPALTFNGQPMQLIMRVHALDKEGQPLENAYWDGLRMTFGDGGDRLYPLMSLDVTGHEIGHGFTQQHSQLAHWGQSGGLNEAFSDMTGKATEFYALGVTNWKVGDGVMKAPNLAIRYMDEPSKDCDGRIPGDHCSIENINDYNEEMNVHKIAGVYNKLFYLLATTPGWDVHKAFDVMVQANHYYWTQYATFESAACGMRRATKDYQYDLNAIDRAAVGVGIFLNSVICPV